MCPPFLGASRSARRDHRLLWEAGLGSQKAVWPSGGISDASGSDTQILDQPIPALRASGT